ncbi:MAG: YCF48-related protein [Tumebacillaceae bacterium]
MKNIRHAALIVLSASLLLASGCGVKSNPVNQTLQPTQTLPASAEVTEQQVEPASLSFEGSSLYFLTQQEGWAGGKGLLLHTNNGGQQWEVRYQGEYEFISLLFVDAKTGWALGVGDHDRALLHTVDGGKHWEVLAHPNKELTDIRFVNDALGYGGPLVTQDGGKTWQPVSAPPQLIGNPYFSNASNGYAVTGDGSQFRIMRTTDGGKTWAKVYEHRTDALTGARLQGANSEDVWVLLYGNSGMTQTSYTLLHSADAGAHWTPVLVHSTAGGGPAPGGEDLNSAGKGPGSRPDQLVVADSQTAFMMGVCPACGEGTVTFGGTADGGKTWSDSSGQWPAQGAKLFFTDAKHGYMLTYSLQKTSRLFTTADGGKTWVAAGYPNVYFPVQF